MFLSRTWYESQIPSSPPDQSLEIREGSNEEEDQISPRQEEQEQLILEDIEDDAARDLEVPVVEEEENDIYDERLEEEVAALAANSANNKEITLAVELEYLQNKSEAQAVLGKTSTSINSLAHHFVGTRAVKELLVSTTKR